MTWFLHAYQWFWLRGTVLFVWQDILFWTILGVLVVVNSLWEAKHGRERKLGKATVDVAEPVDADAEDRRYLLLHLHPVVVLD